ncbi:MAG: biotin transporter BioY, partial [Saprospiraceae bacterium]|nr:biotin transporter BioY [Saprospiraceae bacterium]
MKLRPYKVALALLAIIMSSYIAVTLPFSLQGIPFTAQSLIVFICAAFLAPTEFTFAIVTYLLLGVIGAPVFAEGTSG